MEQANNKEYIRIICAKTIRSVSEHVTVQREEKVRSDVLS